MRYLLYLLATVVGIAVLLLLVQIIASETGEVVVLTTRTDDGPKDTRLWVVDLDGTQYLRAGAESGWYRRLTMEPDVRLTRGGVTASYRAEARPPAATQVNRLMREKYGWRDVIIDLLLDKQNDAIAVALVPA